MAWCSEMNLIHCPFCSNGALVFQYRCLHIATPKQRVTLLNEEIAVSKEMLRRADPYQLVHDLEYEAWYKRAVWHLDRSEVQLLQAVREVEGLPPLTLAA